jgi:ankyrin repeat protein
VARRGSSKLIGADSAEIRIAVRVAASAGDADLSLHAAVMNEDVDSVRTIVERGERSALRAVDHAGNTALHLAASGHAEILGTLLRCQALDVNALNSDRNTPLHYFVQRFVAADCETPWRLFVSRGANLNEHNRYGETPLHKACLNEIKHLPMVKLLLAEATVSSH